MTCCFRPKGCIGGRVMDCILGARLAQKILRVIFQPHGSLRGVCVGLNPRRQLLRVGGWLGHDLDSLKIERQI
jgi:hypothetical protein